MDAVSVPLEGLVENTHSQNLLCRFTFRMTAALSSVGSAPALEAAAPGLLLMGGRSQCRCLPNLGG